MNLRMPKLQARLPYPLCRRLPIWSYICPKCRLEVPKNSHVCPFCDEVYFNPVRVPPTILKDPARLEHYVHTEIFPKLSNSERNYLAQHFTTLWEAYFEGNDFSEFDVTNGTPLVALTAPHHGTYHMSVNGNGDWAYKTIAAVTEGWVRAYIRLSAMPTVDWEQCQFCRFYDATGVREISTMGLTFLNLEVHWDLRYQDSGINNVRSDEQTDPSVDTYYCVEMRAKCGAGSAEYQMWVDGVELSDVAQAAKTSVSANFNRVFVGFNWLGFATTMFIDCVVVADIYIGVEPDIVGGGILAQTV